MKDKIGKKCWTFDMAYGDKAVVKQHTIADYVVPPMVDYGRNATGAQPGSYYVTTRKIKLGPYEVAWSLQDLVEKAYDRGRSDKAEEVAEALGFDD